MPHEESALIKTPYGAIRVTWMGALLTGVHIGPYGVCSGSTEGRRREIDFPPLRELIDYFEGKPVTFSAQLDRGTYSDFQWQVWTALREILYGETRSYGWVARRIGRPTASRAVGGAVGRNPFAIVVPCHRVIGASGDLVGFGSGLDWKRALLGIEGSLSPSR